MGNDLSGKPVASEVGERGFGHENPISGQFEQAVKATPLSRLQDPLSLRMLPQIFGAAFGQLLRTGEVVLEATSQTDDNPVILSGEVLTSGGSLANLRAPIDAFFDRVTVNDPDPSLRSNRLRLLSTIRATLNAVADFSKIEAKAEAERPRGE